MSASRRRSTRAGVPVLQVVSATTQRAAWRDSARGLGAADLAMHVVLPELDGRVLAGAVAFKDPLPPQEEPGVHGACEPARSRTGSRWSRIASPRSSACAHCRARERRIAVLMPDYPGAPGRTGYAVGLDVPASVIALLDDLAAAGYARARRAEDAARTARRARCRRRRRHACDRRNTKACWPRCRRAAVARLARGLGRAGGRSRYARRRLPFPRAKIRQCSWSRCRPIAAAPRERRADYHDPPLPPRHALVAFGLWLQHVAKVDALVHMGAHGTLEWLPGKAVALTAECFPEIVTGPLPVIYPFIVSNPGEAAQAKRRIAARDHRPSAAAARRRRAFRRRARARAPDRRICAGRRPRPPPPRAARRPDRRDARSAPAWRARPASARAVAPDDALRRIDAWLCDLKDLAIKDGLHIYGRAPAGRRRSGVAGKRRSRAHGAARSA